jgi:hypothetical protein
LREKNKKKQIEEVFDARASWGAAVLRPYMIALLDGVGWRLRLAGRCDSVRSRHL